ncbi:MAG: DUF1549 domain-containing protein [Planctomycetia bacterium]|nr:DUF1549 domain-containing protein [Planctomycetia bacterium]
MLRFASVAVAMFMIAGSLASADDGTFFRQQVAPIFERHCVSCHGGVKPKGGLVLVDQKRTLAGGESGAVVEPGKPDESLLFQYISGEKPEMPKDAAPLSADEVGAVRRWIAEGANWPEGLTLADKKAIDGNWWSLAPLAKVVVPAIDSPWVRTPVDAFILAKLEEQHLAPSADADRRTLVRRLTYDLHGLPPTPEEIDAFLADTSGDAYANLVDRLLASPRYGERWGRYWLDVVHFGESHGYDKDKPRPNAWPYRDYVIHSLNEDKPYDRFVEEQIAGDVLYPLDPQATVATGFIAAGPWDFVGHVELREGTVDKDIARSNDRDDMVANTMSSFVSLTVHCARCHNHKFDPIRQEDYYGLQAVFAGIDRADRPYDADSQVAVERTRLAAEKARLDARLATLRERIDQITSPEIAGLDAKLSQWKAELALLPAEKTSKTLGYHSQIMPTRDETKWVQVDLGRSMPIDQIVLVPAHVVFGDHPGPGFGFPPRFKVELSDSADFAEKRTIADHTAVDFPHPGDKPYRVSTAGATGRYVRVTASQLWKRTNDWIFALAELLVLSGSENVALAKTVTSLDSIEAPPSWAMKNLVDGYSSLTQIVPEGATQPSRRQGLEDELERGAASRRQLVHDRLDESTRKELAAVERDLKDVDCRVSALPKPRMVYAAANQFAAQGSFTSPQVPRPIHLLARGDVRSPQQSVAAAPVACVRGPDARFALAEANQESERRAALAHWLGDSRNALVRRSIVNRVWHYHFGQGIVDTPNDFGRMGSLPTHPELLEWLAGWLIDHGHSLKELHRLLLTSSVYRQSSQMRGEFAKLDAGNRYLWRMNRQRLDAESIRDAMLAVSGKLDLTMGGPSVQQFYFKDDHSPVYDYTQFDVDDARSLRRSVYRFLVRSVPDPFMECLDCADPSIMTPKRNTTLTSIQALALLNNPFATRQAEHFAERLRGLTSELPAQVKLAYRLALGREPNNREAAALTDYATRHGLTNACRVIFNSNEFVFID